MPRDIELDGAAYRSPLSPLRSMDGALDDFGREMRTIDSHIRNLSEHYGMLHDLREQAEQNSREMATHIEQLLGERTSLIEQNSILTKENAELQGRIDVLQERNADLERQAEARRFNPELRKQNDKLVQTVEELRGDRQKELDDREADTRRDIFDRLLRAMQEQDALYCSFGKQAQWFDVLQTMRTMYRDFPELPKGIDELLTEHIRQGAPSAGVTVGHVGSLTLNDIHDNASVKA